MSPLSRLTLFTAITGALVSPILAQATAQPLPDAAEQPPAASAPPATDKAQADLLKALEALQTQLGSAKSKQTGTALAAFQAAATGDDKAYSLFMDCKKKVDFEDKGKTGSEFEKWRRLDEAKALHDPEFTSVLKLQLQWLILSIQAGNATTDTAFGTVVAQVPAFLDSLFANYKRMNRFRGELNRDVIDSVFGRFYKLDITLGRRDGWSYNPLNIDSIFDTVILPYLRGQKNASNVNASWKKRIQMHLDMFEIEEREAKANPNSTAEERSIKFKEEKMPRMEWGMLKDSYQMAAEKNSATSAMLAHIRNHLGHKDAALWIEEMTKLANHEDVEPTTIADTPGGDPRRPVNQNQKGRTR